MKKKITFILLMCGLTLNFSACGSKTANLSDYSVEVPVYGLTEYDRTEKVQVFDIVLDDKGRIVEKRENTNTITYTYDELGRVQTVTSVSPYGTDVDTYTYTERGFIDSVSESSDHTARNGNVFSYQYKLDEAGQVIEKTVVNTTDPEQYTSRFTYDYDENGYLNMIHEYGMYGEYATAPEYDAFGQVYGEVIASTVSSLRKTYYTYGEVGTRTISTETDTSLITGDQWETFEENDELPTPNSCVATITAQPDMNQNRTYTFCLPAGTAVERFLTADDQILIPGGQSKAYEAYLLYCNILTDVLGYTLEEQEDGSVLIIEDGIEKATISVSLDKKYGSLMQLTFK